MNRLELVEERLQKSKKIYFEGKGKRDQLMNEKLQKEEQIKRLREEIEIFTHARLLLQKASEFAREQAREQIEKLVTYILQFVFGDDFSFAIEIEERHNRHEAEFYVITSYEGFTVKSKPQETRGGGVTDVVSLALRIAMLSLYNPTIQGPLLLDEPAKHVSDEYIRNVAGMLQETSLRFGRQVVMITHNQYLSDIADRSFKVELVEGESQVLVSS